MENYLISLFQKYQLEKSCKIIQLENKDHIPVGSIDLTKANLDNFVLLETTRIDEKYLISIDGISIFFTYFRKIED